MIESDNKLLHLLKKLELKAHLASDGEFKFFTVDEAHEALSEEFFVFDIDEAYKAIGGKGDLKELIQKTLALRQENPENYHVSANFSLLT
ncbi:hypothetical protein RE474_11470 [Methanolobus sediminis]|uniref:Uncharacterized protein n=1 Tax=Methanolobus sediminis TaxID=3072978 RepID=A0AA51UK11_9EURY|nr:hypothetical protein [Methanolobus sediminis]WMW24692.1 hypothetical protein RE474_11470 [Methanolobus sediminis]